MHALFYSQFSISIQIDLQLWITKIIRTPRAMNDIFLIEVAKSFCCKSFFTKQSHTSLYHPSILDILVCKHLLFKSVRSAAASYEDAYITPTEFLAYFFCHFPSCIINFPSLGFKMWDQLLFYRLICVLFIWLSICIFVFMTWNDLVYI